MYWPKEGSELYGIVQVKLTQEVELATYTIRTFVIRNLKVKKVNYCVNNLVLLLHINML